MTKTATNYYNKMRDYVILYRRIFIFALLFIQAILANYLAFVIRFESFFYIPYIYEFAFYLPILLTIRFIFFLSNGLYKGLLRYASISDLLNIIKSATLGSIVFLITIRYLIGDTFYPRSIYFLDWLLFVIISSATRLFIRLFREYMTFESFKKKILVVGAGDAGEMIARDMKNNPGHRYDLIGFIDSDQHKKGLTIHGIPIFGPIDMIPDVIKEHRPDEILIATDGQHTIREIYEVCKPYNIIIKRLPTLNEILDGSVSATKKLGQRLIDEKLVSESQVLEALELQKKEGGRLGSKLVKLGYLKEDRLVSFLGSQYGIPHMRPISLEDLLQREPVRTDIKIVRDFIKGKSVIVTGGGGSIGSELCRQILKYDPSNLIILDRNENGLFYIDHELRESRANSNIATIVGDIQDTAYLRNIFFMYKPQIVFHAAAYKHVPMMECNVIEAIKNNIFGTKNMLDLSEEHGAETFVMISTDKAVNPTSIMGATKRVAEFLTTNKNSSSPMVCTTVRFGNVLGTNGSVVTVFKEQLNRGGPLTVTHPEMERFFMLVPEAIQLVLIAAASGKGGEIFVLDMGEPIRIIDLAENIIRLSGYIPHEEVKIMFTGLRPGEKLHEELFDEFEKVVPTYHNKLRIAVSDVPSPLLLKGHISCLERSLQSFSIEEAVTEIKKIVPNFKLNGVYQKEYVVGK